MHFRPNAELEAFRLEVRAFLEEKLPAEIAHFPRVLFSSPEVIRPWQKILNDHGWGAPSWDKAHGGTGWSVEQLLIFDEECMRAGAPSQDGFSQKLLGPVLNHFATPEQWQEHVPPILKGERLWCQGFSEPGSGSDLASLRTRAEPAGDHYVVNGQKIWTSYAHVADWIFMLVRTDADAKHAGISFLLVDMKSPGITVRPIISIDGHHHLNEVFFDDVRVPVGNLIGGEGKGWSVTKFLLNNEHATTADLPSLKAYLRQMKQRALAERLGDAPLIERPEYAIQIARFETELQAVSMMVARTAAMHGEESAAAHAMGSMLKLRATDLQQRMTLFLVEIMGDSGAVAEADGNNAGDGLAAQMFLRRASTIYGGTSEVQRGIVAKALYGL